MRTSAFILGVLLLTGPHLGPSPAFALSLQDSVIVGVCEGALTPIAIVLPSGDLGANCGAPLVLRHGWRDGDPGTYVFLDLPPCPHSLCRSLPTSDRLRCEILVGNPCCLLGDLIGREFGVLTGARMGPILDGLQGRFDSDTDHRAGCYAIYQGNTSRILRVLVVEPVSSKGRNTFRVMSGGHFFLRERQGKTDDLTGEWIPPR